MASGTDPQFERRLAALVNAREPGVLQGGLKGVEKESLRVMPDGRIAHTPHPHALGSALSNEHITTDFSESLLELVTPAFARSAELMRYLTDLHRFVFRHMGDELLWATSMPCELAGDADIPTAQYGSSNSGLMKTVYREGLRNRYGAAMQAISGVHFNYSFPAHFWEVYADVCASRENRQDFQSRGYFDLLRNYRRHGWIVLYLFGVSPAVSRSFLEGADVGLDALDAHTLYGAHSTSLRMSDVGYRNRSQSAIQVSVNSLADYIRDLRHAIGTPHPPYAEMGVRQGDRWLQLNTNLLQIENEYYSYIRPKRVVRAGETPSAALQRGGVEYVEMRALDVSAFDPVGVNDNKLRFLEAFAAYCLLRSSPPIEPSEQQALDDNHLQAARRGREPGLMLSSEGRPVMLSVWAAKMLDEMTGICELLDQGDATRPYTAALQAQREKVLDTAATPSARLLHELRANGESFQQLGLRVSSLHKDYFLALQTPDEGRLSRFADEARESLQAQQGLEAAQRDEPFAQYLARYFAALPR
ncbi:MAG: glutamate--cysteine ligase [Nevskiaceae bacterium]|jgi:glutamate--cysteine ligase|nr:glutamate--cysteine ligase [Nevskiaceae bacterium]